MDTSLLRRVALVLLGGLVVFVILRVVSCGGVRVGTYNIRRFGVEPTDMDRLAAIIEDLDADVLAVQEIQSQERMGDLARRLSKGGRRYAFRLSSCGGRSAMHLGVLYDEARVKLVATREYPELDPNGRGACSDGERPGFAAELDDGRRTFHVLVVHLIAGGERDNLRRRKEQWRLAHEIAKDLGRSGPVVLLGDTNSTGFLDDEGGERTFIEGEAKDAGLELLTASLGCTEYFGPAAGPLRPSLLDHAVASPGLSASRSAQVHGFCRALACAPTAHPPADFTKVSDHCPVTFDLR